MSGLATAVVASAVVGGVVSSNSAGKAADAQVQASKLGTAEQRRQFDVIQGLLKPYVDAGETALTGQENLIGLRGPGEQQKAIAALEQSPQFQTLIQQGEEGILQNAAATGGLRGGNLQGALAQFRPQLLSQLIESQFGKLGQLTQTGQASAAGTGTAAQNTGSAITNLLTQQGQARAGAQLARGQAVSGVTNAISDIATLKLLGAF